jgi:hypothetical protein
MHLLLDESERRAMLRSFALVSFSVAAASAVLVAARLHRPWMEAAACLAAVGAAAVVWFAPAAMERPYRGWNRFVVEPFQRVATAVILQACFFLLLGAVGRARRHVVRESGHPRQQSSWKPLEPAPVDADADGSWMIRYARWAARTNNLWSLALVPFLALLDLVSEEHRAAAQANIYTLF